MSDHKRRGEVLEYLHQSSCRATDHTTHSCLSRPFNSLVDPHLFCHGGHRQHLPHIDHICLRVVLILLILTCTSFNFPCLVDYRLWSERETTENSALLTLHHNVYKLGITRRKSRRSRKVIPDTLFYRLTINQMAT